MEDSADKPEKFWLINNISWDESDIM
jgi:hypothetical protein